MLKESRFSIAQKQFFAAVVPYKGSRTPVGATVLIEDLDSPVRLSFFIWGRRFN